jgi:hypothetical protein
VKTIDLPREGWVETPLVYAVLRAKNPAVDRLPSIQLDMDFIAQPGQVVLPVMSQVQPLDARDDSVPVRPCPGLMLDLVLDEREWKEGGLAVEIHARGHGIIPDLDAMFDWQREGFDVEVAENALSVIEFVSDGKQRLPKADRNWQLAYTRKPDLKGDVKFLFPVLNPGVDAAGIEFKHYQGADLVTLDAAMAAAGVKLPGTVANRARNAILLALLAAAAAFLLIVLIRRKSIVRPASGKSGVPAELTPFNTIAFLRRIREDRAKLLTAEDRAALDAHIHEIESACFSGRESTQVDLAAMIGKWKTAGTGSASP